MLPESLKTVKPLRIKFEKSGVAKYISHLDLNRILSRSFARAKINLAHTEGFNPRPKITFASAISLGIESLCEFADIKIIGDEPETQIFEKINNVLPQGIKILDVYIPENSFKNIYTTRFHISLKPEGFGIDEIDSMFEGDTIVEKKPGLNINLKDYICEMITSGEMSEYKLIDAVLKTNQEMFLNPENIIKYIQSKYTVEEYYIKKFESYDKNGEVFK